MNVDRYTQISEALQAIAVENLRASADMIEKTTGFVSERPNHFDEAAVAARQALANPMLIGALAKHLFGEVEED